MKSRLSLVMHNNEELKLLYIDVISYLHLVYYCSILALLILIKLFVKKSTFKFFFGDIEKYFILKYDNFKFH
jgi:hypothetical protein